MSAADSESESKSGFSETLRRALAARGTADALAFSGRWRSWHWLSRTVDELDRLLAEAGASPRFPAALVARNRPQHVAAMVAQLASRRATSMVYAQQSAQRIAADIAALRLPLVLADESDWTPQLHEAVAASRALGIALDDREHSAIAGWAQHSRSAGPLATERPAVGMELLSSGTTGAPQRVPLSWTSIERIVGDAKIAYTGSDHYEAPLLMVYPLGNIAGLAYIAPAVVNGQRIVLMEKFEARQWAEAVRIYRPTRTALPPAALQMVLDAAIPRSALESLTLIAVGGARLGAELQNNFEATYHIPLITAYGATEFGGVIANWTLPSYRQWGAAKRGSVGRAMGEVSLRIVDPRTSAPLPPGHVGLLEARVPRIGEHWIRTTDLAALDEEGFLYLHGRADDAINRGGFKVLPEEVAACSGAIRQWLMPWSSDARTRGWARCPSQRSSCAPALRSSPRNSSAWRARSCCRIKCRRRS